MAWVGLRFERGRRRPEPEAAVARRRRRRDTRRELLEGILRARRRLRGSRAHVSRLVFDPVTELPERATFQAAWRRRSLTSRRSLDPPPCCSSGLDDFGWVNDRLDRRAGDLVLREIATVLRGGLRTHDHVARYGGAIFSVILRDTPLEDGRMVAENVVRRLGDPSTTEASFAWISARACGGRNRRARGRSGTGPPGGPGLERGQADSFGAVRVWEKGTDVEHVGASIRFRDLHRGQVQGLSQHEALDGLGGGGGRLL